MPVVGRIAEIWRYPVSSLGGERVMRARLDERGVDGDRVWGLADAQSNEVAGPERSKRWRPAPNVLSRAGRVPQICLPGGEWLPADDPEASRLISDYLGFQVALKPHGGSPGKVQPRYERDDIHLLTSASLARLRELLPAESVVDTRRFRPNVVVNTSEDLTGFAEQAWIGREVRLGAARIRITSPCERCSFTALEQRGVPFDKAVLAQIARHGGGGFGTLCAMVGEGEIAVGDEVELVEGP